MTLGKTGVCVLAAQAGAKVHVIDVGIDAELIPGVINMRVARGCGNIAVGPAMRRSQAEELLLEVMRYTRGLAEDGVTLFGVGELGMANTTPAAAIVSARRAGTTATFDQLNKYFLISQMTVIGSRYWNMVHGMTPEDVRKDEEGMQTMRILGRNMAYQLKCLEAARKAGVQPPAWEPDVLTNFIH